MSHLIGNGRSTNSNVDRADSPSPRPTPPLNSSTNRPIRRYTPVSGGRSRIGPSASNRYAISAPPSPVGEVGVRPRQLGVDLDLVVLECHAADAPHLELGA